MSIYHLILHLLYINLDKKCNRTPPTQPPNHPPLNTKNINFLFFLAEVLILGIIFVNGPVIIHVKHIHFIPIIQKTIHPNRHRFVPTSLSL